MQRKQELFEMATDIGIKIINARTKDDANVSAIHILNPDMESLEDAIWSASREGFDTVMIHSRQTWPIEFKKEKFEKNAKLLA
jgi:hypothetical protein